MGGNDLVQIDIGKDGGVNHHHIVVVAVFQEVHIGGQAFQLAPVGVVDGGGVGGEEFQAALSQLQAPFLAVAHMVHQGLVAEPGDDAHVPDTGKGEVGQAEVHLAVAAAEGQGGHGAFVGQLTDVGIIGEKNTHYIHFRFLLTACRPGPARRSRG